MAEVVAAAGEAEAVDVAGAEDSRKVQPLERVFFFIELFCYVTIILRGFHHYGRINIILSPFYSTIMGHGWRWCASHTIS